MSRVVLEPVAAETKTLVPMSSLGLGGREIRLLIQDAAGVPVSGAEVVAYPHQREDGVLSATAGARSDASGLAVIRQLRSVRYDVRIGGAQGTWVMSVFPVSSDGVAPEIPGAPEPYALIGADLVGRYPPGVSPLQAIQTSTVIADVLVEGVAADRRYRVFDSVTGTLLASGSGDSISANIPARDLVDVLVYDDHPSLWAPGATVAPNQTVQPREYNGHYYAALSGGVAGGTEPVWPTNGGAVGDGSVVWGDQGKIRPGAVFTGRPLQPDPPPALPAGAEIQFVGAAGQQYLSASTRFVVDGLVEAVPAGTVAGDLVLAWVFARSRTIAPVGWALARSVRLSQAVTFYETLELWTKIVTEDDVLSPIEWLWAPSPASFFRATVHYQAFRSVAPIGLIATRAGGESADTIFSGVDNPIQSRGYYAVPGLPPTATNQVLTAAVSSVNAFEGSNLIGLSQTTPLNAGGEKRLLAGADVLANGQPVSPYAVGGTLQLVNSITALVGETP